MVVTQFRSKRKPSGGRYRAHGKKKLCHSGNHPALPKIGERQAKMFRIKGGHTKLKIAFDNFVNVIDQATKKASKVKMKTVVDCPANKQYTRQNILIKGSVVDTELGKVRITNRPAQDGCVNGILIK
jgi:small subunit ribosomal protein S8e